ncbi:oxidoreductase [Pseudalkalibacillus sp. SCS-8]|uniref:oxidoreductase n=1 Tax=Pseudalkalibacillus nanhaiensis TaxID=3115291 RepID=UPI0032DBCBD9
MNPVKVGLIGYGLSGKVFHAPFFRTLPEYELQLVSTSKPENVHADMENVKVVPTPEEVIDSDQVELVVITAPNEYHFSLGKQALEAGKHVVIEKPFVVHSEEGEALMKLAEEKGLVLSPYHNRRWDNDFLTVRKLIESGALGEVMSYEAHFDRYRPNVRDRWREKPVPGGGILFDLGSHLIDQALQLFGNKPKHVGADVKAQREDATVDDYFHLRLDYDPLQVILHSSALVRSPGPRFQVHGTKGSFVKYGTDPQESQLREGKMPRSTGWGLDQEQTYGILTNDEYTDGKRIMTETGQYEAYYEQIFESIRNGAPLPVTAQQGTDVIRIIEACK